MSRYTAAIPESEATVRHVLTHTSQAPPGTAYRYDGNRFAALTAVVTACHGKPFRQALAEILDRAAMTSSVPGHDLEQPTAALAALFDTSATARYAAAVRRLSTPYQTQGQSFSKTDFPPRDISASAGLLSSVIDLARYDAAIDANIFISAASQTLAWTNAQSTTSASELPHGLGWFSQRVNGVRVIWHYGQWPQVLSVVHQGPGAASHADPAGQQWRPGSGVSTRQWRSHGVAIRAHLPGTVPVKEALIALAVALSAATPAQAQVAVTPFVSANVRTYPGFIDLDDAASKVHGGFGVAVSLLTDGWIGVEGETTFIPSAFSGHDLVDSSRFVTVSGSVLALAPARWGWFVRPYVSFGAGIGQIKSVDVARIFEVDSSQVIATAGAGVWMWFGPRLGLRTGVRLVRSLRTVEIDSLETWQPSLGISLRF